MDHVKLPPVLRDKFQRITQMKLKRIVFLRSIIHADYIKSSAVVTNRTAAGSAKCVE